MRFIEHPASGQFVHDLYVFVGVEQREIFQCRRLRWNRQYVL